MSTWRGRRLFLGKRKPRELIGILEKGTGGGCLSHSRAASSGSKEYFLCSLYVCPVIRSCLNRKRIKKKYI